MSLTLTESLYDGFSEYLHRHHQLKLESGHSPIHEMRLEVAKADLYGILPGAIYRESDRDQQTLLLRESDTLIRSVRTSDICDITITGPDRAEVGRIRNLLASTLTAAPPRIKWVYNTDGESVRLPLDTDSLPQTEFYPFLQQETLSQYYDRYMASKSNILVLIGPPGTGKTSFVKGLVAHTGRGAVISYDDTVLKSDEVFATFMVGRETFMVLEDADTFLGSRSRSGNTIMHKFLNVGDGLMSTGRKKIIFSTNLPSVRDIDPALIRPGRCFAVLRFDKLTKEDCVRIKPDYRGEGGVTLAELMNPSQSTDDRLSRQVGF